MGVQYSDDNLQLVALKVVVIPYTGTVDARLAKLGTINNGYYYNDITRTFKPCYEPCWFELNMADRLLETGYLHGDTKLSSDYRRGKVSRYSAIHGFVDEDNFDTASISMDVAVTIDEYESTSAEHFMSLVLNTLYTELEYGVHMGVLSESEFSSAYRALETKLSDLNW